MSNPFFEGYTYPWSRPDARALHQALYRTPALQNLPEIRRLYEASGANLQPLAAANPAAVWTEALNCLTSARRLEEFCRLLLEEAAYAAIHDAVRAIQNAKDSIEDVVLSDDRLFIDRQQLRDKLQRLMGSQSRRVLLVRGGVKCGKTWTQYMIADLAFSRDERCIYLSEDIVRTLEDVLENLFLTLGGENAKRPDPAETPDAWYQRICRNLIPLAARAGRPTWVVIDDLGVGNDGPHFDPAIKQFFDQFALAMVNPEFARWFRLVLIDYPEGPVPTKWRDFWDEDRPDVAHVDPAAITRFVVQWAQGKEKQIGPDDAERFAHRIVAAADATSDPLTPRLKSIHDALVTALPTL